MIDLRSDTLTLPTTPMREAMARAAVGDDVFGEDPTLNKLEARVAEMLGKQAALFVPSGTMSNQIGVRLSCRPGDEFVCDSECHIYHYEQAAYAQLFGVAARPLDSQWGLPPADAIGGLVRGSDQHHPRTKLLTIENTHNRRGGIVLDYDALASTCQAAHDAGMRTHLDGARIWNAVVATERPACEWAQHFDTVSVCFSKGLGAPVGSALCGTADDIAEARRVRKALGGGMRQAGVLAAAALYALEHHVARLRDDHRHADLLAQAVGDSPMLSVVPIGPDAPQRTNLLFIEVDPAWGTARELTRKLADAGVLVLDLGPQRIRAVTHLGVSREEAQRAAEVLIDLSHSRLY